MTKTYDNHRTLIICLLIALILHLLLSLTLFVKFDTSKTKELLAQKDSSSLKPAPSAPVFMYDEEEPQPVQKTSDTKLMPSNTNQEQPEQTKFQKKENKRTTEAKLKSQKIKDEVDQAEKLLQPIEIDKPQEMRDKIKIIEEKSKEIRNKIDNIAQQQEKTQNTNLSEHSTIENAKRLIQSDQAIKALPKLANLTQGFINYMREEGNNQFLERKGNSDKIDPHEAKLISYYNKIISFFHRASRTTTNEFSQIVERYVSMNSGAIKIEVGIKLIINKNGSLADIILMQNSGFRAYDNYIMKTFESAAPFPPVPDHLSKDELVFPLMIYTPLEKPGFSLRIG